MPSEGPLSPGTVISSGGGTAWSNPSNAASSNNSYATCNSSAGTALLRATNFGFAIPTDALVVGVLTEIECFDENVAGSLQTFLIKGAGPTRSPGAKFTTINSSEAYRSDGGPTDLWSGMSLTPAEVNASTFGLETNRSSTGTSNVISVDHIRITVYYEFPGALAGDETALMLVRRRGARDRLSRGIVRRAYESFVAVRISNLPAAIFPEIQWASGGVSSSTAELQWAMGGRASKAITTLWQVAPSPLRIEYALTGRTGPVTYTFRFERRTRTNQFLQDITPAVLGGSIEGNNNRPIFRTGSFTIDANARDDSGNLITINPLADHLAVFMDLLVDGNYTLTLQMGLFALTVPHKTITPGSEIWEVEAYDNCIHLAEATTTATYTIDAGENYLTGTDAASDILDAQSIPHALPSTDKTLVAPQSWPPGTPWLTIVNWLLDRVNLYQLACDATGVARTRVRDDMSARTPDVAYQDMLLIPIAEEAETTRLANQVIAVVDDPAQPPLSAVVTNNDPANPISVATLGRTFSRTIRVDGAPDETTLEEIARNYLEREAGLYRRASLLTSIDPRREANEIYEVTAEGVYAAERWWAQAWSFELSIGAQMGHSVGKVERITA